MYLIPNDIKNNPYWYGWNWVISNKDELAYLVARVAVGQSEVVVRILNDPDIINFPVPKNSFDSARELLQYKPGSKRDQYNRDGWVFQVISWIASHYKKKELDLIRSPHMIKAHKGFDGLIVESDEYEVSQVTICEEKATEEPRDLVLEALKEIKNLENGKKTNLLVSELNRLLRDKGLIERDKVDEIVAEIVWDEKRAYRISVTIENKFSDNEEYKKLFKDYEEFVKEIDDLHKRRAETFVIPDLRNWIDNFADSVVEIIDEMENGQNV